VTTTVLERTSTSTKDAVTRAYVYALDPTPEQVSMLRSHVGGSRYAYNALLGLVKENWDENRAKKEAGVEVTQEDWIDTSHFGLHYLWGDKRDEMAPWWPENGSSTYNDATQRLSKACTNFRKGRAKFPNFKHKGRGGSVRFTNQSVRLTDSHHVRVARIGEVKTYESTRNLYRHLSRGTGKVLAATLSERSGKWRSRSPSRSPARSTSPVSPRGSSALTSGSPPCTRAPLPTAPSSWRSITPITS
jgi:putative transposase